MNQTKSCRAVPQLSTLTIYIFTLLITACGVNSVKHDQISETESCNRLQGTIKDHPNKFNGYKKNYSAHKTHRSWTADKVLPSADQCQVWEWSTGLNNYICEWKIEEGESQAIANFEEAAKVVTDCLDPNWTVKTNTTTSGGKNSVYSSASSPTVVSIRYFQDTAGWNWLNKWHNTIIIGDKNNLDAHLQ